MAITNAQQFKQLVNPPMEGKKRPGYRGDDAARSSEGTRGGRADPGGAGRGDTRGDPGPVERPGSADNRREQYAVTGNLRNVKSEKQLDREAEFDKFKYTRPEVNVPGLFGRLLKKPIQKFADFSARKNRAFFEDVIRAGKIPGLSFDMTQQELEKAYDDYMSARLSGEIDAFGNPLNQGDDSSPLLFPRSGIMAQAPEEDEEPEYVNPLSKLSPRIAGSQFAADGGLAAIDREAFLLGGIAKGLKKATRAVKKIVKSPIGKAALLGAGLGFAGIGPFKGLAGTSFGQGLAGLRGTLFGQAGSRVGEAFVPFKEGLFTKLGLTKGGGSLMPTVFGGITLASILPLLAGKTDDEKDQILKDYYASQKLEPGTTIRQAGSEFDFYNYNLAEGGTPRKEPVAKKVMPLLDMGGMEKDYRAEGGFVPIGRMEKADDVPARLSKNEFVFTADAVRNAGDGDVDKGAEVMYNMMKNLEAGGDVSKESQGLDGARKMFQTSQRLGEVKLERQMQVSKQDKMLQEHLQQDNKI